MLQRRSKEEKRSQPEFPPVPGNLSPKPRLVSAIAPGPDAATRREAGEAGVVSHGLGDAAEPGERSLRPVLRDGACHGGVLVEGSVTVTDLTTPTPSSARQMGT